MNQKGLIQIFIVGLLLIAVGGSLIFYKYATSTSKSVVPLFDFSHKSASPSPHPSPRPSPAGTPEAVASSAPKPDSSQVIDESSDSKSVSFKAGIPFSIELNDVETATFDSYISFDPQGIVISDIAPGAGTRVYSAYYKEPLIGIKAGQTAVTILSRPHCNIGQACPHFIKAFKVFITITSAK